MKMFKGQLLILLIIYIRSSFCALDAVYDTGKEIWKLYSIIDNMTSTIDYSSSQQYKYQVDEIHKQLQKIENSMDSKVIADSFKSWPYPIALYKALDTLEIFILAIDQHYDNFRQQISEMKYHADDLRHFMRSVLSDIEEKILTMREKISKPIAFPHQNLIFVISGHASFEQPNICISRRILSAVLIQLFKMIVIAEMKAHAMSAIVKKYPYMSDNNEYSEWTNLLSRETLETQIGHYVNLFSLNILIMDRIYLRACEPSNDHWIRDESFYELEGTFQTAIFRYDWEKCNVNTCHDIWFEESRKCEAHYYDDRTGCSGNLTECIDLNTIQACVLRNSTYKFHHVHSSVKGLFGNPSECPDFDSYTIVDRAGWNLSHSACACNCNGNDNKISLSIMESNVKSNMVIIGLRFIRRNRILYIQPKEGKLYSDGRIRRYSQRWIPIPENIPESQLHQINRENRVFFFDDLRLPSSFVLTGVKFNRVQRLSVIGFAVNIFGVPFNFDSGELNSDPNFVLSKQAPNNNLGEPLLFMTINPVRGTLPLTLSPAAKKYVSLERSNLRDDFGQSTLPFFDAVPIIPNPPLPLGGIGIFHKGAAGSSGFISLRVYGIKYAHFFTDFQATRMKNNKVLFNRAQ